MGQSNSVMKLIGIKCGNEIYLSQFSERGYSKYQSVSGYIINGRKPKNSFNDNWSIIKSVPKTVQQSVKQDDINYRYELIDREMKSNKTPLMLTREECCWHDDDEYCWKWKEKYATYESLYKLVSDNVPDVIEDLDFEYQTIMSVKEINRPIELTYDTQRSRFAPDKLYKLTQADIHYQLIDEIVFPEIILPSRPCALSTKDSYLLIRQYVKQHINLEVATVTSDYDFCFTVKKKIPLSETEKYTVDINFSLFSKRKPIPKYETRYKKHREITIFEMAPKNYNDYPTIDAFKGNNDKDLKRKIDEYCKGLIKFINEPVGDCPRCKGRGVVMNRPKKAKL